MPGTAPTQPKTPPSANQEVVRPQTPPQLRPPSAQGQPRTPRTPRTPAVSNSASAYLSSPIRRSRNHHSLLSSGAMTPGRPGARLWQLSSSPYRPPRVPSSPAVYTSSPSRMPPSSPGRVQFDTSEQLLTMPIQTLLMTQEQARKVDSLEKCRELLAQALEQSERFRSAAQTFRTHATNLRFQQKLAQIERDESEQRHEVESSIQQREIERLVADIMGYSDSNIGTEQIRQKLHSTRARLHEMEELLNSKNMEIKELKDQLAAREVYPHQMGLPEPQLMGNTGGSTNISLRGPPVIVSTSNAGPTPAVSELSDLEMIASQVLSSGIRRRRPSSSSTISARSDDDTLEEVLE